MSQKAVKRHDYYKINTSILQENQPTRGSLNDDTAHSYATNVRNSDKKRMRARNRKYVLNVLKWDTIIASARG